jgi:hypothetical protein
VAVLARPTECHLGVDFSYQPSVIYHGYVSSSLGETLLKARLADLAEGNTEEKLAEMGRLALEHVPKYMMMQALHVEQKLSAGITNYNKLDRFQMKQLFTDWDCEKAFKELKLRMNSEYEGAADKVCVLDPVVGMPVAAPYDEGGDRLMW